MVIEIVVYIFFMYLLIGFLFSIWFVFWGVQKLDHGMDGAKLTMKLLLIPGTIGLWPILLRKYFTKK